ncbi:adenosylcobinamide-phosphate synthase CbiB [Phreatobacter cathodiphilus]|uniref:Cobalamin biosynthesis protein CobD n=1 Tax=Phreatobacter cathodiphilus TaxID=1868589 RepID=A0A2S0NF34_9HYPH|nr:adenosylcobinamide-phosphate synthase CbiB [Phreatobacter cathodiphilus]AVO46551.1 cobalamin biosynthesis protein [Phreatobacter cathodiphilus]
MSPVSPLAVLALALVVEAAAGYPQGLFRLIGHPVTWIGRLIGTLDRRMNREDRPAPARRRAGVAALAILLAVTGGAALAAESVLEPLGLIGGFLLAVLASTLLAQRSLHDHVAAVAEALETGGLEAGRRAVSMIVGRDPDRLDEAGVSRAAIESLAENFSDGVTAPAFWLGLLGLPGIVLYKAINTADSMIGHRNPRHEAFGWAAARLDDLVNLPASRLSAGLIIAAAALDGPEPARRAWRCVRRDARRHRSPNSGWPEAAMAGALGLRLAGPRVYGTVLVADAFMGEGRIEAHAGDIRAALRLYRRALAIGWGIVAVLVLLALSL